jgi:hypothetical protein
MSDFLFGKTFIADFDVKVFELHYENQSTLILKEIKGPSAGRVQELVVKIVELRPKLFIVNWQENTKLTVTDIEDYDQGVVYANLTTPNGNFENLKGTLKEKRSGELYGC